MSKILKRFWSWFLVGVFLFWGISACGDTQKQKSANFSQFNQPLPEVAPLVTPQLPDWIEQISPTQTAETLAQIKIRFKEPLIPLESLESTAEKEKLKLFEIEPKIPGKFRFLTPRMVGFQSDVAFPKATRIKVTLKSGLKDLKNHHLEQDLAWTFNTEPIKLTNLPQIQENEYADPEYIDVKPQLTFTSNVQLDVKSLGEKVQLIPRGSQTGIPLTVEENDDLASLTPGETFDPALRTWSYTLTPRRNLEKATRYRLEFAPGIRPFPGNLPSDTQFVSEVETYSPLKLERMELIGQPDFGGAYGRFVNGTPELKFNNKLELNSVLENITITPPPKEGVNAVQAYDGESSVTINPWGLEPNTKYIITIGKDVKDIFGQTLGQTVTQEYNTGDIAASIWAPDGLNIFPAQQNLELNISTVNLPESQYKATYQVVQPTDLVYVSSAYPTGNATDLLPNQATWQTFPIFGEKNQPQTITVPLREKLGKNTGLLAYGVSAKTNRYVMDGKKEWREPTFYGMVQLTNLGVFSQWFPEMGLIHVNHLSDGAAVPGATVQVYQSQTDSKTRGNPTPCATGTTDNSGTLVLTSAQVKSCSKEADEPPEVLVIVREGDDWAFDRTWSWSGAYGYGIYGDWHSDKPVSRGTIFSDRRLYQPGEKVAVTGVAYYLTNGQLTADKNDVYSLVLRDPDGKEKELGTPKTNEFGTFSWEFTLDENQPLGYYSLQGKGKNEGEIYGEFRVAEFKPPNFKVDLNLSQAIAKPNETVAANIQSNYLFGSPVSNGQVQYYVTRSPARNFTPKGWEKYSFGRQWFWPEEQPSISSDVREENAVLDRRGSGNFQVQVDRDLPYPMTYRVDAEVTDLANLSVSSSQTFTALPSDKLIGLKSQWVADAGKPFSVELIVTNPQGEAIAGESIRLELQKMTYSRVNRVVAGSRNRRYQVEYTTVDRQDIKSAQEAKTVNLTAPESGSYRIRAFLGNNTDEITATDLQIWATGGGSVFWASRSEEDNFLEVKLDKETYQPGETATALIQSPYPEAELYFAVVRDRPLYQTLTKVTGGAPQIQFTVTPEMLPNAAVQAVLIRQGQPLEQLEPGSVEDLVKIGFAPFNINLAEKYLQVDVTPNQEKIAPGTATTVKLQVKDAAGQPVKGQFTVMVVNEAILQLTGYRPPDLVKTVYADQPIATRFSDNRFQVVISPLSSPLDKGWGYGGGFSAGADSTRLRTEFKPLAYYNGSVITDQRGQATVSFSLPDDLTTWRVMAVATTEDMRFGQGDNTFMTTKPLMANPVLPQFVRLGDRFDGGLTVTNTTARVGNLVINGSVSNNLLFAEKSTHHQTLRTKADWDTQVYRFPMTANSLGEGKVRFTAQLNQQQGDAFEVPLSVRQLPVSETVVQSGVTNTQVTIPVNVDKNVEGTVGGLNIDLASTLIPEITAPARQIFAEDRLPFLEPAASELASAANLQILGKKYSQTFTAFNPTNQAKLALEQLSKLQLADGGFGFWPGSSNSDPFMSPYAAESLAQAKAAGFAVNDSMISRLRVYLQQTLADPGKYDYCNTQVCKNRVRLGALIGLAELGDRRNDFLADIYAQRGELDRVAQTKLARYLMQVPGWVNEAKTMWNELQETVYETGRSATVNLPEDWGWLSPPTVAQAQTLRLALAQNSSPEISDRLLQGLLNLRRNGTWQTTYSNAEALAALVDYANTQPTPPNFTATVKLAGQNIDSMQFQGYQNPSQFINLAMDQLPQGKSDLTLSKSGQGNLHYFVEYNYRLKGNQPGRFNGLRVDRTIRPAGQDTVLETIGLSAPKKPLQVPAGQVFDIGLEIITDRPVNHLVITDPLPAGFEAVDTTFQTATKAVQTQQDSWEISYQTIYKDRVMAYANRLGPGLYRLHYLVRSVTPGTFEWPGAEVKLQYAPEEFGRSASTTLEVK